MVTKNWDSTSNSEITVWSMAKEMDGTEHSLSCNFQILAFVTKLTLPE